MRLRKAQVDEAAEGKEVAGILGHADEGHERAKVAGDDVDA